MSNNGWISVKERMPKNGEVVLTVRCHRLTDKLYVAMDKMSSDVQWIYAMQDITLYWQPLPELPEELR